MPSPPRSGIGFASEGVGNVTLSADCLKLGRQETCKQEPRKQEPSKEEPGEPTSTRRARSAFLPRIISVEATESGLGFFSGKGQFGASMLGTDFMQIQAWRL